MRRPRRSGAKRFASSDGSLGRQAEIWRTRLIEALALVEARIDFSDEADVPEDLVGAGARGRAHAAR